MKLHLNIIAALMTIFTMASCADDNDVELRSNEADRTLVFYILADNNLASYMLDNVIAAESGVEQGIPPTSRMVVYLDKADTTLLYEIGYMPYGSENYIKYSKPIKGYPRQNSNTPTVMRKVLDDVQQLVPSRYYSLVLSAHGTGWFPKSMKETSIINQRAPGLRDEYDFSASDDAKLTRAWGYDGGNMSDEAGWMSGEELAEGLSGISLDCLIFDACFMSSIELLYDLRSSARYIIASPTEVMASGFPYKVIVPMILGINPDLPEVAKAIVDTYRNTSFGGEHSSSIALVDCSEIEALAASVRAICVSDSKLNVSKSSIQPMESMSRHAFYDLKGYFAAMTDDAGLTADFERAFANAVAWHDNTDKVYSAYNGYIPSVGEELAIEGINCYIPSDNTPVTNSFWRQTSWAKAISMGD